MSKGLGKVQREILEAVAARGVTTMESLRWELSPPLARGAVKLPNSWNTSFSRAVESLKGRGQLQVTDRPLANLNEWQDHYPGKTLNVEARRLRVELIPPLIDWVKAPDGPSARYTKADNEAFALKQYNQEHVAGMTANWKAMKPALLTALGQNHSSDLFVLLARGSQIFETDPDVSSRRPFRVLAADCLTKNLLPTPVVPEMKRLVTDLLTTEEAGALRFRSYMHSLTKGVPSRGHCELSPEAKEELYQRKPHFMAALPGFKAAPSKTNIQFILSKGRASHGPILKKVLDQSVFHDFRFLEIATSSTTPPEAANSA